MCVDVKVILKALLLLLTELCHITRILIYKVNFIFNRLSVT